MIPYTPPNVLHPVTDVIIPHRQAQVLDGLALGLSYVEIGRQLWLTEHTIHTHAKRLYRKLGARNGCHAVYLAVSGRVRIDVDGAR